MAPMTNGPVPPLIGARGYAHACWRGAFYPDNLPREWRFLFYSHRYPALLMPARAWGSDPARLAAFGEEAPADFRVVLEISEKGLLGNHGAVGKSGTGATLVQTGANSSMLSVTPTGVWLTNSDGQVVLLHGFNEVYKLAPYDPAASGFSEDDAAFLAANGFNVVRLGVIWAGVEPQPGVYDAAYIDSIRQTVDMLAAHGIYTIIDMHQDLYSASLGGEGAPEWATKTGGLPNRSFGFPGSYYLNPAETAAWDGFWNNTTAANGIGLEDNYAKAWETVAAAVAGNTSVIGYDIMNEPFPGTSWLPTLLGSPFYATQQLTPMYNQVAAAIRAVDPNTALFVEPANPAVSEVPAILGLPIQLGTIDDAKVVLALRP